MTQVVYKPFMAAMLAEIANTTAPAPPGAWITRILDALPKDNLDAGGDSPTCVLKVLALSRCSAGVQEGVGEVRPRAGSDLL